MSLEKTITFNEFFHMVQEEVRKEISRRIHDEDMKYALEGGKLLRPTMLLLSFKACNGNSSKYKKALESAVGVELAHSASLLHDDIMDGDVERRGKPALHIIKGVGTAILVGHKMINEAFRISLDHGEKNARIFLDTWSETLIGQLKDIDFNAKLEEIFNGRKPEKLLEEYFKIIEMKTASLFAAACRAGAIEAEAPEKVINLIKEYGKEVGIAYQLADDLVDIVEGKIEEGIIMPLIRAYGNNVDTHFIEMLKKNGKSIIEEALKERGINLREIYEEEIKKHVEKAVELASSPLLPESIYKELLKEAPQYIVDAMIKKINGEVA
ncbi:MAG: polyprenyl synthetase family protein [Thermoplasmata archaeon]|nr:MAG: polyprenyl synthetase family protein [Thermoplasmata archaeon]